MPWYAFLLAPFALIFWVITKVRNLLFDLKILKSFQSPIPTLIVGNLSVGGTGKTPMVEFLIQHLRDQFEVVGLSRGYGRKTKGFIQVKTNASATEIGDEPLQIYRRFEGEIPFFVGEDRVASLVEIAKINPKTELAILDDAFQHRKLKGDCYCLLTPFDSLFSSDYVLPMGRLRESRFGGKRADFVVVTKCPETLTLSQRENVRGELSKYLNGKTPIFFSSILYGKPTALGHNQPFYDSVLVVSGLADDRPFVAHCQAKYQVLDVLTFPDHHDYDQASAKTISLLTKKHQTQSPVFLTTEKDAVKLKSLAEQGFLGEIPIFVLPIEANFETEDKQMLLSYIRNKFKK